MARHAKIRRPSVYGRVMSPLEYGQRLTPPSGSSESLREALIEHTRGKLTGAEFIHVDVVSGAEAIGRLIEVEDWTPQGAGALIVKVSGREMVIALGY